MNIQLYPLSLLQTNGIDNPGFQPFWSENQVRDFAGNSFSGGVICAILASLLVMWPEQQEKSNDAGGQDDLLDFAIGLANTQCADSTPGSTSPTLQSMMPTHRMREGHLVP